MERNNQPSAEERMIQYQVDKARNSEDGDVIPVWAARVIASLFHDGQTSALYSFASCGAIDKEKLIPELVRNLRAFEDDHNAYSQIDELGRYLAGHGARGPVPNWEEQTKWDLAPEVLTEERLMWVVKTIAPLAFMDQADDGELVIFTRLTTDEDGTLRPVDN